MKLPEFQQVLRKQHLDLALLIHPDINITYFTQVSPSYAFLAITPVTATLYLTKLDSFPHLKNISVKNISKNWLNDFKSKKIRKIGINKKILTVSQAEKFKKLWPQAKFVDISATLEQLRATKTPEEIIKITKACQITSTALQKLVQRWPQLRVKTERDVAEFIDAEFRRQGAEPAFPTIVAMGKNAAIPHHVPDETSLSRGFLVIDFGAKYQHYCADMTRTLYLGRPSAAEREYYHLVQQAQQEAINAVQERKQFTELDKIARKNLGKYSSYFIHSLGHGIGLEVHETPTFSDVQQKIIQNQVFTIEPGIYFPGKLGIRIEDTLVWDGKIQILTLFSKELKTLKLP